MKEGLHHSIIDVEVQVALLGRTGRYFQLLFQVGKVIGIYTFGRVNDC